MHHEFQKFTTYVLPANELALTGLPSSVSRLNLGTDLCSCTSRGTDASVRCCTASTTPNATRTTAIPNAIHRVALRAVTLQPRPARAARRPPVRHREPPG